MPWYVGVIVVFGSAAFALLLTVPLWDRLARRMTDDLERIEEGSEPGKR